jgi:hypothetical protein
MNNVLVIVFSSEFFTPLEPTVAAMYMIPFFGLILPAEGIWGLEKKEKNQALITKARKCEDTKCLHSILISCFPAFVVFLP